MKNILVTLDFDKNNYKLIEMAHKMGHALKAKVWLLHVTSPLVHYDEFTNTQSALEIRLNLAAELKDEHAAIQEAAGHLTSLGLEAEGLMLSGMTTELIMKKSSELAIDLIITGHHNHGFFYNALLGSTSADIIKKAKIPVMVVPLD